MDSGAPALKGDKCWNFMSLSCPLWIWHILGFLSQGRRRMDVSKLSRTQKIHVSPWLLEQIRQSAALKILGFWDSPEGNGIIIPGEHTSPSAISSCPIPRYLRGETNPHLPAPSWNKIITDILFVLRTFRNQRKCHFGCIINNISVYISY